jgi:hypothetical protein
MYSSAANFGKGNGHCSHGPLFSQSSAVCDMAVCHCDTIQPVGRRLELTKLFACTESNGLALSIR